MAKVPIKKSPRLRLDGLKFIAAYLKLSQGKTQQLYRITVPPELRLPVFRLQPMGARNRRLYAWKDELDAWVQRMGDRDLYRE